jgi:hypothetical protein
MAPGSYRPISLLNAIYKMYAALLADRLKNILDPTLGATHFGFRENRSTSQAVYMVQRTIDFLKAGQTDGGILFFRLGKSI